MEVTPKDKRKKCERCGERLSSSMATHQARPKCRAAWKKAQMERAGYTIMNSFQVEIAGWVPGLLQRAETLYEQPRFGRGGRFENQTWGPRWLAKFFPSAWEMKRNFPEGHNFRDEEIVEACGQLAKRAKEDAEFLAQLHTIDDLDGSRGLLTLALGAQQRAARLRAEAEKHREQARKILAQAREMEARAEELDPRSVPGTALETAS